MDNMENNDISQTSPDGENIAPEEYNPYDSFLEDNDNNSQNENGVSENDFEDGIKKEPISDEKVSSNNVSEQKKDENEESNITTEEDIQIPSFLQGGTTTHKLKNEQEDEFTTFQSESENNIDSNNFNSEEEQSSFNPNAERPAFASKKEEKTEANNESAEKKDDNNNEATIGGDTNDENKENDIAFEKKVSPDDAEKHPSSKPKVLNKKFLASSKI